MKKFGIAALLVVLLPLGASAQTELVAAVKNDLVARQLNLEGPCGAFEITKRVAWILRAQGVGLLEKTAGNNCQGYSVDYIVRADFSGVDILGDAGGENTPAWGENEPPGAFAGRWRPAFDPGDAPTQPIPGPVEPIPGIDPTAALTLLQQTVNEFREEFRGEALLAHKERVAAREFREQVRSRYVRAAGFMGKYVAPAIIAYLTGRELAQ